MKKPKASFETRQIANDSINLHRNSSTQSNAVRSDLEIMRDERYKQQQYIWRAKSLGVGSANGRTPAFPECSMRTSVDQRLNSFKVEVEASLGLVL